MYLAVMKILGIPSVNLTRAPRKSIILSWLEEMKSAQEMFMPTTLLASLDLFVTTVGTAPMLKLSAGFKRFTNH